MSEVEQPLAEAVRAFSDLVAEAEKSGAWWRVSPLLAATGLAHYLDQRGYEVVPKDARKLMEDPR